MNSDLFNDAAFDELLDVTRWDKGGVSGAAVIAAVASYRNLKKAMPPTITPPDSTQEFSKLVLAGSRACTLASLIINHTKTVPMLQDIAKQVMLDWGLEIKETPPPPETVVAPDELVWPPVDLRGRPLADKLNPAYFKVHWHAREVLVNGTGIAGNLIDPEHQLHLIDAYWDEEQYVWRMHFTDVSIPNDQRFWISHCKVRPSKGTAA